MKIIQSKDFYNIVEEMYRDDPEILTADIEKYENLDLCVQGTVKDLLRAYNLKYFSVFENNELVGYFGYEDMDIKHLCTFFIKKSKRNNEFNKKFFNLIKSTIGCNFYAGMRDCNPRALKYYQKMGGSIVSEFIADNCKNYLLEFKGE